MKTITLYVGAEDIRAVGDLPPIDLGPCAKFRASVVVPVKPWTHRLFVEIRYLLGNNLGRWLSRRLPGPWKAIILSSGESFQAPTRDECIRWEVRRLEQIMENN